MSKNVFLAVSEKEGLKNDAESKSGSLLNVLQHTSNEEEQNATKLVEIEMKSVLEQPSMLQKRRDELTALIELKESELANLKKELIEVEAQLLANTVGDCTTSTVHVENKEAVGITSVRPAGTRRLGSIMRIEADKAQKKDVLEKEWFQHTSLGLVVCIMLLCFISIYAGRESTGERGPSSNGSSIKSRKCIDTSQMQSYSNSSIVMNTLIEHCDCVPKWIGKDQGVYFQPFATLYIAIFAVLGFMFFNRFRPMLKSFIRGCARSNTLKQLFSKFITEVDPIPTMVRLLNIFHDLPEQLQTVIEQELKLTWPDMPSIIADENQRSGTAALTASSEDTLIDEKAGALAVYASAEFVDWFMQRVNKGTAEVENMIDAFSTSVFSHSEEMYEEADRADNVVIFFMELLLGVYVLMDYFFVQQWPSGSAWQCRWAYFAGVVMYKPYTVPMWFCLTLCCHYSFADKLNNNRRDLKSGTPYGAPFNRSKVSMFMMSTVALLQAVWFLVTFSVIFPLLFMFLPVILLPCFLIPFVLIFGTQKFLSLLSNSTNKYQNAVVEENRETLDIEQESLSNEAAILEGPNTPSETDESSEKNNGKYSSTSSSLKPTPFVESVFSLKAAATQLVSISIIAFLLLPLYDKGIGWWQEGADQFVGISFDLPNIVFDMSYTLSWPKFKQPRLAFQLALGLFLASLQILFRSFKYMFFKYALWITCSDEKPHTSENQFQFVFSIVTWLPFRAAMEATQAAIPKLNDLWAEDLDQWLGVIPPKPKKNLWNARNYLASVKKIKSTIYYKCFWIVSRIFLSIPITVIGFSIYALFYKRSVKFNGTFEAMSAFLDTEDAMAYNEFVFGTKFDIPAMYVICPLLLQKCCWAKIRSDHQKPGETFIMLVARSGFPNFLQVLIQYGYDIDETNRNGDTALIGSAEQGQKEAVALLLDANADIDRKNKEGNTALMMASHADQREVVKLLLKAKASIDLQNEYGHSALIRSVYAGKSEAIKILLEAEANLELQDTFGHTALYFPLKFLTGSSYYRRVMNQLLEAGANVDAQDMTGETVLFASAEKGTIEAVELLLEAKANADLQDKYGTTPLMTSCQFGHIEVVRMLLEVSVEIDRRDKYGATALMIASEYGHIEVVRMLLIAEADADLQEDGGKTALDLAREKGHGEVAELLEAHRRRD